MAKYRHATREQLVGTITAIHDFATTGEQRRTIAWEDYDNVSVSQLAAPVEIIGVDNDRIRNLLRDIKRKDDYEVLLNVVGKLNVYETEGFYRKAWWQIRANHLVPECRAKFGVDQETFAKMMGSTLRSIIAYENFYEFNNDLSLIYAFEQTANIEPPKTDEFRRKFRRAVREFRATQKT
jgi:hypothetical protein